MPHALGPVDLAKIEDRTLPGGARPESPETGREVKTARAVETANGSVETSAEHLALGAFDDEFEVNSLLAALQGSSSEASVGAIGNDVLKLTVRNEVGRRLRHQRKAIDDLRSAVSKKDRAIADLQRRLTAVERERAIWFGSGAVARTRRAFSGAGLCRRALPGRVALTPELGGLFFY